MEPIKPQRLVFSGQSRIHQRQVKTSVGLGFNPYSTKIDFSRQNLTYVDVRFWRLKSIPAL